MSLEIKKTSVIILRKTPYKETSIIVSSISPDYGRLDFIIRGALQITKIKSPIVDLFRELEIEFKEKGGDLQTPSAMDLITAYDNISLYPKYFNTVCRIAAFLTKNTFSNVSCKNVYSAFKNILTILSSGMEVQHPETLIRLVYLHENGLLPKALSDFNNRTALKQNKFITHLIKFAMGEIESLPNLNEEYWSRFNSWILNLCRFHHLYI